MAQTNVNIRMDENLKKNFTVKITLVINSTNVIFG